MQVCTSLQTDNHANTPPLSFLQARCPSCRPTNSVKALKAWQRYINRHLPYHTILVACLISFTSPAYLLHTWVMWFSYAWYLCYCCVQSNCFVSEPAESASVSAINWYKAADFQERWSKKLTVHFLKAQNIQIYVCIPKLFLCQQDFLNKLWCIFLIFLQMVPYVQKTITSNQLTASPVIPLLSTVELYCNLLSLDHFLLILCCLSSVFTSHTSRMSKIVSCALWLLECTVASNEIHRYIGTSRLI